MSSVHYECGCWFNEESGMVECCDYHDNIDAAVEMEYEMNNL